MTPEAGFLTALLTTVALLVGAAVMGRSRRIRAHVAFVVCAVASLAVAIACALRLGQLYDLEAAGVITPIHLTIARITTLIYLWPLVTGPLAARGRVPKRVHHAGAYLALGMTLLATATGVLMLLGAERLPG
ncbi:MAG: hypothetical protein AAGA20_05410 [Planctomycetota bacterium]